MNTGSSAALPTVTRNGRTLEWYVMQFRTLTLCNHNVGFRVLCQFVQENPDSASVCAIGAWLPLTAFSCSFQVSVIQSDTTFDIYIAKRCSDRLCGLVVRVSGYRYRGPGFDSRRYQIFWVVVGLERGPLSLNQLRSYLNKKVAAPGLENRD